MGGIKRAAKALLGRDLVGRNISVSPSDAFLVSFPRSGNTWLRFLIANAVVSENVSFSTIEKIIPDIYQNYDRALRRSNNRRILKSHEPFEPRYKRVVYLVRDPRDVLVSHYHFHRKTRVVRDDYSLNDYVAHFLSGETDPRTPIGSWGEHVGSWLGARKGDTDFLLLKYEDLTVEPEKVLGSVLNFLDVEFSWECLSQAVHDSSFEEMRRLEGEGAERWPTTKGSRPDIAFVRRGRIGGWVDELSSTQARRILDRWPNLCAEFGYE